MLLRFRVLAIGLLAAGLVAAAGAQEGPKASFDCAKAATAVEKAICKGGYTAELDGILAALYRAVRAKTEAPKRAAIDAAQREWLGLRNTRCGAAKPDGECLARLHKHRIIVLARQWRAVGGVREGTGISGRYAYREQGEAGEMFLAEVPGGVYVLIDTVNANHRSPHVCGFSGTSAARTGDVLDVSDPEASKSCGLRITVKGKEAVLRERPAECYDIARYYCGAHGAMLGRYVLR